MLEQKLQEELNRFRAINKYGKKMIMEQDVPPVPDAPAAEEPAAEAPAGDLPPLDAPAAPDAAVPEVPAGPDTPMVDSPEGDSTEEIDITDLVNMTKNIKNQLDSTKDNNNDVIQKMDGVFSKLSDLEQKLAQMDSVMSKIDELGSRIEQVKPKTPQEKLEMRSLDSYPFNQHPQDFFSQKQEEMRQTGKNEYVLTKDEVESYGKEQIMKSFNPDQDENEPQY